MNKDICGVPRGRCTCGQCKEYLVPENGCLCEYCGCVPTKHADMRKQASQDNRGGASLDSRNDTCKTVHGKHVGGHAHTDSKVKRENSRAMHDKHIKNNQEGQGHSQRKTGTKLVSSGAERNAHGKNYGTREHRDSVSDTPKMKYGWDVAKERPAESRRDLGRDDHCKNIAQHDKTGDDRPRDTVSKGKETQRRIKDSAGISVPSPKRSSEKDHGYSSSKRPELKQTNEKCTDVKIQRITIPLIEMKPCKLLHKAHVPYTAIHSVKPGVQGVYKIAYNWDTIYVGNPSSNVIQQLRKQFSGNGQKDLFNFLQGLSRDELGNVSVFWVPEKTVHNCGSSSYVKCIGALQGHKPLFNGLSNKDVSHTKERKSDQFPYQAHQRINRIQSDNTDSRRKSDGVSKASTTTGSRQASGLPVPQNQKTATKRHQSHDSESLSVTKKAKVDHPAKPKQRVYVSGDGSKILSMKPDEETERHSNHTISPRSPEFVQRSEDVDLSGTVTSPQAENKMIQKPQPDASCSQSGTKNDGSKGNPRQIIGKSGFTVKSKPEKLFSAKAIQHASSASSSWNTESTSDTDVSSISYMGQSESSLKRIKIDRPPSQLTSLQRAPYQVEKRIIQLLSREPVHSPIHSQTHVNVKERSAEHSQQGTHESKDFPKHEAVSFQTSSKPWKPTFESHSQDKGGKRRKEEHNRTIPMSTVHPHTGGINSRNILQRASVTPFPNDDMDEEDEEEEDKAPTEKGWIEGFSSFFKGMFGH